MSSQHLGIATHLFLAPRPIPIDQDRVAQPERLTISLVEIVLREFVPVTGAVQNSRTGYSRGALGGSREGPGGGEAKIRLARVEFQLL